MDGQVVILEEIPDEDYEPTEEGKLFVNICRDILFLTFLLYFVDYHRNKGICYIS